jgi:hypothetical protein
VTSRLAAGPRPPHGSKLTPAPGRQSPWTPTQIPGLPPCDARSAPNSRTRASLTCAAPTISLTSLKSCRGNPGRSAASAFPAGSPAPAKAPGIVNAWWDWGFGDWESPLGAASHTGQRGIAEFLLEKGARIDIFAAAMMGMTEVVKAFVTAHPGIQRTLGPHGIPLLAHATVGGPKAEATLAYLKSLGDAGETIKVAPLEVARKPFYVGQYAVEDGNERFEIKLNKGGQLTIDIKVDGDNNSRWINYLGNDEFFPSGVPSVRLRFDVQDGKARAFTINDDKLVLTATRANG